MQTAIKIGDREVGTGKATYIIAEIGTNHNQDLDLAREMIDRCAASGVDAVKFQSIQYDQIYASSQDDKDFRSWFKQIELDEAWHLELAIYARGAGVEFLSSATYPGAIDLLEKCNVHAYKLASPQIQGNLPLVRSVAEIGKPIFFSIGYSVYGDIATAMKIFREAGNESVIPLHCTSKYPTPPSETNLRFMATLAAMTGRPVGYSDHTMGIHVPVAAVALGACVIEKHVTMDPNAAGPDHHFALPLSDLPDMVTQIREVEAALGDGTRVTLLDEEMALRDTVRLKAVASTDIAAGSRIEEENLIFRRAVDDGIGWEDQRLLKRCVASHAIAKDTLLKWDLLSLANE